LYQFPLCPYSWFLQTNAPRGRVSTLDGKPFWMKLSQVGSHKKVLIILWGHT
jgi:hypothetical protein